MRFSVIAWLVVAGIATAQSTTGFSGGSGGGGTGGLGGGSGGGGGFTGGSGSGGSGSGSSSATAGVEGRTLLNSFGSSTGSRSNSAISSSNPFAGFYYNPYAQGLISGSGQQSNIMGFGQAVFSSTSTGGSASGRTNSGISGGFGSTSSLGSSGQRTSGMGTTGSGNQNSGLGGMNSLTGGRTGTNMSGGFGGATQQNTMGRNTGSMGFSPGSISSAGNSAMGVNRTAPISAATPSGLKSGILYSTNVGFPVAIVPVNDHQTRLADVFLRSTSFRAPGDMQVNFNNGLVILRGIVASESEAIRAENLMRLEPGVRDVKNELRVQQ